MLFGGKNYEVKTCKKKKRATSYEVDFLFIKKYIYIVYKENLQKEKGAKLSQSHPAYPKRSE